MTPCSFPEPLIPPSFPSGWRGMIYRAHSAGLPSLKSSHSEFAPYAPIPLTSVRTPLGILTRKILGHLVLGEELPRVLCHPLELIQRESSLPLPE